MYKFVPIVKTLVWGTESWVLSGVPGNESVVADGPAAGTPITEIFPGQFPLLIKFIDARQDLSIQVHPDDELAAARHNCKGKTEMWYVTGADAGARLLSGLKRKITPEEYVRLVEEDRIVEVLDSYEVREGDVFFLPAGRIHAIGGGCRIAEIQQTSDITYRIYDYNRPGLDGKPRQLHTGLAKDAIDYSVLRDYRSRYTPCRNSRVDVVTCPYFTTSVLDLDRPFREDVSGMGEFQILVCMEGSAEVVSSGSSARIAAGEAGLFLGEREFEIRPSPTCKMLLTH